MSEEADNTQDVPAEMERAMKRDSPSAPWGCDNCCSVVVITEETS